MSGGWLASQTPTRDPVSESKVSGSRERASKVVL